MKSRLSATGRVLRWDRPQMLERIYNVEYNNIGDHMALNLIIKWFMDGIVISLIIDKIT